MVIGQNDTTNLPLIWGGTSIRPAVSGTLLEWGGLALGTLLRMEEESLPLEYLLREAFSARAAATREEWSLAFVRLDERAGELKRSEASGSFSTEGEAEDDCGLFSSGGWLDEESDFVLHKSA